MSQTLVPENSMYARETARRLRVDPTDPDALFASAALLAANRRFDAAILMLNELGKMDPEYPGLWRFKARMYREAGDRTMETLCNAAAQRQESGRP